MTAATTNMSLFKTKRLSTEENASFATFAALSQGLADSHVLKTHSRAAEHFGTNMENNSQLTFGR